jgi:hypothetical protein
VRRQPRVHTLVSSREPRLGFHHHPTTTFTVHWRRYTAVRQHGSSQAPAGVDWG